MFFRRPKTHVPTFEERLRTLQEFGIRSSMKGGGSAVVMRGECAAVVKQTGENAYTVDPLGVIVGQEIGELCDGGNQKYWLTPSGKKEPALAEQLKDLHAFGEDLREGLGLTSFYNEGLGSVNSLHLYDRVKDRDRGEPRRAWEKVGA
jgi:hypothetical protein